MASRGGWKAGSGRRIFTLPRDVALTPANKKKLALEVATIIRDRAFPNSGVGHDDRGRAYGGYSTKPIYVSKNSPPRPADMPAPVGVSAATAAKGNATDKRGRRRGVSLKKSVRYDGGYSQYRSSIGRSSGSAKNLVLTGQTARALSFLRATRHSVIIGFRTRKARARHLDAEYEFLGLTPAEKRRVVAIWRKLVREQIRRR